MNSFRSLLIAGAVIVSAAPAFARPALVVSDVNLRAGPTTASPSFGVIPGGSTVHVGDCGNGWCAASAFGRQGFIASRYLDLGGPPPGPAVGTVVPVAPPPPVYRVPPPYYGPYRPYRRPYYY